MDKRKKHLLAQTVQNALYNLNLGSACWALLHAVGVLFGLAQIKTQARYALRSSDHQALSHVARKSGSNHDG
jgi:hypothetical protein